MAAPTFGAAGTYTKTTAASAAVVVPAGTAADEVVVVYIYKENTAAVTPPAGFTECTNSPTATTTDVSQQRIYWKRLTGADSGTYSFTWTGSVWTEHVAIRISGCGTTGDPTEINNAATSGSTNVTTTPAVSGTTGGADRLLLWSSTNFAGSGTPTMPGSFTRRDGAAGGSAMGVGTLAQASAGATGSLTGSWSVSAVQTAFLLALSPDGGAAPRLPYVRPSLAVLQRSVW